jgi:hypothetical protein
MRRADPEVDFSAQILQNLGSGPVLARVPGASKTVAGIDPKFYYLTLGLLILCTVVGLIVTYRFQREVNEDLAPPTEKDLLGPLEKAFYSGLMREEEFQRIQESMARQKGEVFVPASKPRKPTVKPSPATGPDPLPEVLTGEGPTDEPPPPITPPVESDPGPSPD